MSARAPSNGQRFRAWDLALESNVDLPELPVGTGGDVVLIRVSEAAASLPPAPDDAGRDGPIAVRHGDGFRIHFVALADFLLFPEASEVRCQPLAGAASETVRHLLLDYVLPVLLSLRGRTVLHAGVVDVGGSAVAFLGETGRGKSTLCASFAEAGCPVIADDCLVLRPVGDQFLALPSYPGLRLWPTSMPVLGGKEKPHRAAPKVRIGPEVAGTVFSECPVPLRRIYVLGAAALGVSIAAIPPVEALLKLVAHSFRTGCEDPARLAREFERLANVSGRVPVRHLVYPRGLGVLAAVREAIANDLKSS